MKTTNKTQNSLFQLQAVSTVNSVNDGGDVTSLLYDIKKLLNTKKFSPFIGRIWYSYQKDTNTSLSLRSAKSLKKPDVVIYKLNPLNKAIYMALF